MYIDDLFFEDNFITGFSEDKLRGGITLTFEAYMKNAGNAPKMYILECYGVSDVNLEISDELQTDLARSYDANGDDQKANEIYALHRDEDGYIHIETDMIKGRFFCEHYHLPRVVSVDSTAG